ncbi:glycosyltransferase family 2 protein [Leifsonia sp. AG29]|uniref:glycosyltransferase family 2 protein n=1 Tax=Leifsonia sp. AG29 TaxID=2598860 RepID=UPI00131AC78D|nr:glycosyltransferase family 2 protein [Leifsonia sp. AG29]
MSTRTAAPAAHPAGRWRRYQEEHLLDDRLLRTAARLARGIPSRASTETARRVVPKGPATVSVVIPCFNYGRYLPEAVGSALEQTGVDVEVIVVDDRSTDDSREVARRITAEHPEVRLIVNEVNSGHVRSFNAGWEASSGEYVVKLDADDLLAPGALGRAVALFEAHPELGLVYGHPYHFSTPEPPEGRVSEVRWDVWAGHRWLEERCRLGVSAITNPEMVLRSSLLRELGPMDPAVPYAPDMEISLRIAAVSDIGYIRGADQALHREHASSMSETDGAGVLVDLEARSEAFRRALAATADRLPDAARLEALARRALAADALRFASAAQDRRRESSLSEQLVDFARSTWPESASWRSVRRLGAQRESGRVGRVGATARRLRRRVRDESYYLRWMVFGV